MPRTTTSRVDSSHTTPIAPCQRLAERLAGDSPFSPFMRRLMIKILEADPPLRTVKDVIRISGRPRSTVHYHWGMEVRAQGGPTLYRFLRWVILLHITEHARAREPTAVVAARIGIDARMLRAFRRHHVAVLRQCDSDSLATLADRMFDELRGRSIRVPCPPMS